MVATKQTIHGSTFERGLIQVGAGNAQPCLRFRLPLPSPPLPAGGAVLWLGLHRLRWKLCFSPDFKVSSTFRASSVAPEGSLNSVDRTYTLHGVV